MKSFLFVCLIFLANMFSANAQDVAALIKEAERLEAIPNEMAAFFKFNEVVKIQHNNVHALSKCSELCSRIGQRQARAKIRDEYYASAKLFAETALKIDPANSEANTSMAIMLGRSTMTKSGKEKVASAKDLKKHVDVALRSDPTNFLAWHVLGRWHYEISSLNFMERAAVKIFYGGFPPYSMKESIAAFERSKALVPGFILNYLELAKAYHSNNENAKAKATLNQMLLLPSHTEDDPAIKEMGKRLLKEWK